MVRFFLQGALAAFLLATTAQGYRAGDQTCSYASSSSSCSLPTITPSQTDSSVLIYPGGKTRCAFDDFKDPVTGFTTNATYFFQVFPKPQQAKKKLALILQGGGACIDAQTCNFALQCSLPAQLVTARANAQSAGILNGTDPNNSFKDWDIVYVPYCTGDLHIGNKVLDAYESGLEVIFKRPQCLGQKKKTYLNGFENVKSAFAWAKANYPDVDELVFGGLSAGSLGAQLLSAHVADLWNVKAKGTRYGLMLDSYIGVIPPTVSGGSIVNYYGGCGSDLKWSSELVALCNNEKLGLLDLNAATIKDLPKTAWLFITSMGDNTQRLFYQLAKDGITGYPFADKISAEDFFIEVNKIMDSYKKISSYVSTFFVDGTQHQFLNKDMYYNVVSASGDALGGFLTQWLKTFGSSDSPTSAPTGAPVPVPTTVAPTPTPTSTGPVTPTPTETRPAC